MAKFKKGDRVIRVSGILDNADLTPIGEINIVDEDNCTLPYGTNKAPKGFRNVIDESEYEIATPSPIPDTVTIGGVEYIRKPEPKHEWKFGDVAVHENYGVGIISCVHTDNEEIELQYNEGENNEWFPYSALTFIRRANLSI